MKKDPINFLDPKWDSAFSGESDKQPSIDTPVIPDNEQGWTSALGTGLERAAVGAGETILNMVAGVDEYVDYHIKAEPEGSWDLKKWATGQAKSLEDFKNTNFKPATEGAKGTVAGAVESVATSLAVGVPLAVAGYFAAPVLGASALLSASLGYIGLGGAAFGLAQKNTAVHKYTEGFIKDGFSPEEARQKAEGPSNIEAGLEWGTETLSNLFDVALMGAGKFVGAPAKIAAKSTLMGLLKTGAYKSALKTGAKIWTSETAGEMINAIGQTATEKVYGESRDLTDVLHDPEFWDGVGDQFGQIAVSSLIFAGLGAGGHIARNRTDSNLLSNGVAPRNKRWAAANRVASEINKESPEMADRFLAGAELAINKGESLDFDAELENVVTDEELISFKARGLVNDETSLDDPLEDLPVGSPDRPDASGLGDITPQEETTTVSDAEQKIRNKVAKEQEDAAEVAAIDEELTSLEGLTQPHQVNRREKLQARRDEIFGVKPREEEVNETDVKTDDEIFDLLYQESENTIFIDKALKKGMTKSEILKSKFMQDERDGNPVLRRLISLNNIQEKIDKETDPVNKFAMISNPENHSAEESTLREQNEELVKALSGEKIDSNDKAKLQSLIRNGRSSQLNELLQGIIDAKNDKKEVTMLINDFMGVTETKTPLDSIYEKLKTQDPQDLLDDAADIEDVDIRKQTIKLLNKAQNHPVLQKIKDALKSNAAPETLTDNVAEIEDVDIRKLAMKIVTQSEVNTRTEPAETGVKLDEESNIEGDKQDGKTEEVTTTEQKKEGSETKEAGEVSLFNDYAEKSMGRYKKTYDENPKQKEAFLEKAKKKWSDGVLNAAKGKRLDDKILDDYIKVNGEEGFFARFRGETEQEGYITPTRRAELKAEKAETKLKEKEQANKLKTIKQKAIDSGDLILTKRKNEPFKNKQSAINARTLQKKVKTHDVVDYEGGYALVRKTDDATKNLSSTETQQPQGVATEKGKGLLRDLEKNIEYLRTNELAKQIQIDKLTNRSVEDLVESGQFTSKAKQVIKDIADIISVEPNLKTLLDDDIKKIMLTAGYGKDFIDANDSQDKDKSGSEKKAPFNQPTTADSKDNTYNISEGEGLTKQKNKMLEAVDEAIAKHPESSKDKITEKQFGKQYHLSTSEDNFVVLEKNKKGKWDVVGKDETKTDLNLKEAKEYARALLRNEATPQGTATFISGGTTFEIPNSVYHLNKFRQKVKTSTGVRFSRDSARTKKPKAMKRMVQAKVNQIIKRLKFTNAPPITAVQSESELPSHLKEQLKEKKANGEVGAIYDPYTQQVFIISDNVHDAADVQTLILHEVAGHHGIRGVLGKRLDSVLDEVFVHFGKNEFGKIAKDYELDLTNQEHQRQAAEEMLAGSQEYDQKHQNFIKRIYAKIRELLRRVGVVKKMTDNDIALLLKQSYKYAQKGKGKFGGTTAFSIKDQGAQPLTGQQTIDAGMLRIASITDGVVHADGVGYSHYDLTPTLMMKPPIQNGTGFLTPDGKYLNRQQALAWVKENRPEAYKALDSVTKKNGLESQAYAYAEGVVTDVSDSAEEFMKQQFGDARFSRKKKTTNKKDTDYLATVERGDMETAQKMVDEAAKAAGYDVKAYHGTEKRFTEGAKTQNIAREKHLNEKRRLKDELHLWISEYLETNDRIINLRKGLDGNHTPQELRGEFKYDTELEVVIADLKSQIVNLPTTPSKISEQEVFNNSFGVLGAGSYFAQDKGYARQHGEYIYSTHLNAHNLYNGNVALDPQFTKQLEKAKKDIARYYQGNSKYSRRMIDALAKSAVLKNAGYNGVINKDSATGQTEYLVFNPNQIKSADPVTRNDAGEVIPLSERFDEKKSDIRFSRKKKTTNKKDQIGKSLFPDVVKSVEENRGRKAKTLTEKFMGHLVEFKNQSLNHFTDLDYKNHAEAGDYLRVYESSDEFAKTVADRQVMKYVKNMKPEEYDVFRQLMAFRDVKMQITKDKAKAPEDRMMDLTKPLAFGHKNEQELDQDIAHFESQATPAIEKAIKERTKFMKDLRATAIRVGVLDEQFRDDDNFFHREVLQYMNDNPKTGVSPGTMVKKQKSRTGASSPFNTEFVEAEYAIVARMVQNIKAKEVLDRTKGDFDVSKAALKKMKDENLSKKEVIPVDKDGNETHVWWTPDANSGWHKVLTITESQIQKVISGIKGMEEINIGEGLVKGKPEEWLIPIDIAKTLDQMKEFKQEDLLSHLGETVLNRWKQWILLNPYRFFKYNVNNTSGDLDITFAAYPDIITKYANQAMKDLIADFRGKASPELQAELLKTMEHAVTAAGMTANDIPDVSEQMRMNKHLDALVPGDSKFGIKAATGKLRNSWLLAKDMSTLRENVLRLAAFRYFKDNFAAGRTQVLGVSKENEVNQLKNLDEKAARLARDLLGDYGNLTQTSEWMRRKMIPFWSWQSINAPRYYRLFKNLSRDELQTGKKGELRAVGTLSWKAGKTALRTAMLFAMVNAWNAAVFPEEEEELGESGRKQLHLILYRRDDGTIMSMRFQGALSDALGWFALEDIDQDMKRLLSGKDTLAQKVNDAITAPFSRLYQGSRPLLKTMVEAGLGISTYPEFTSPRPVRDKIRHILRTFSLDKIYDQAAGKPIAGGSHIEQLGKDLMNVFAYSTDPGITAYYDTRKLASDFMEKETGQQRPTVAPTSKSNALYYYKQSLRFGDVKAAEKYLKKYYALGGKASGIKISLKAIHPLGGVPKKYRTKFINSLDKGEKVRYQSALKFYQKAYFTRR